MILEFLLKGIVVGFFASVPLGPVGVLCIQRTINKGRVSGVFSGMGAATVDSAFALIAVLGLSFIIQFIEEKQLYFQIIGGAILIFIGIRIFNANPIAQIRKQKRQKSRLIEDYLSVLVLTLTNPLAVFLFVAAFAGLGVVAAKGNLVYSWVIIGGVFVGAMVWWFALTSFVNLFRKKFRLKQLWWINKIAGILVFVFGIFAVVMVFVKFDSLL